jgi:hypothetical protein
MVGGVISPTGVHVVRHVVLEARPGQEHAAIHDHNLEEKNVRVLTKKLKVVSRLRIAQSMVAGVISLTGVPVVRHVVLEVKQGQEHAAIPGHSLAGKNVLVIGQRLTAAS